MNKSVARIGDTAVGHTDILGNSITGVIQNGSSDNLNSGVGIANDESVVFFPSHPHATDEGSPINYRSHSVKITASGKHYSNDEKIALDDDIVYVADEAGGNAVISATSSNLYCKSV